MAVVLNLSVDGRHSIILIVIRQELMRTKKRKWKRRLIFLASFLIVVAAISAYLAFARFHFSTQTIWPLSQLQWNHQPNVEYDGIRPQIIGHRGSGIHSSDGDLVIGNTYNAIDDGIEAGVDWIEIDVRASSGPDPVLVVFHDERIDDKTTGEGAVSELSMAELKDVWVNVTPQERILTLEEVFTKFHKKQAKWILDVKAKGIHVQVLEWLNDKIENGKLTSDQVIIFGTYDILTDYRDSGYGYSLGYTAIWKNFDNRLRVLFRQTQIIDRCRDLECDYLVLPVIFANRSLVNTAKSHEFNVWVYGVDDKRDFNYLANHGITGFIVDDPKLFAIVGDGNFADADNKALDRSR